MRRNNIPDHTSNQLCSSSQFSQSKVPAATIQSQKPLSGKSKGYIERSNGDQCDQTSLQEKAIIYQRHRIMSSSTRKNMNKDIPFQQVSEMKKVDKEIDNMSAKPYENIENI